MLVGRQAGRHQAVRLKAEKERELDGGRLGTYALECGSGNALRPESRVRARLNELLLLLLLQMGGLFSFFFFLSPRDRAVSPDATKSLTSPDSGDCVSCRFARRQPMGGRTAGVGGRGITVESGGRVHPYGYGAGGSFADVRLWFTGSPFSHPRVRLLVRRCGWLRFAFAFCSS